MLASQFFARSQGTDCIGPSECHWCAAPCFRQWPHDEAPPTPFSKARSPARRPGNQYICAGCWLWRRKRATIPFLGGGFLDGQCPMRHSWLVTDDGAWSMGPESFGTLYKVLLRPPLRWMLSIVDGREANQLQCAVVNEFAIVAADTKLIFTVNNAPFVYTVYELEEAIRHGAQGKEGGVQELLRMHRPDRELVDKAAEGKRGRGRPQKVDEDDGRVVSRMIRRSGYDTAVS